MKFSGPTQPKGIQLKMGRLDQAKPLSEQPKWRHLMIWGPPGTGKTVLACSSPNSVLVEIDPGGSISLGNHPDISKDILVIGSENINGLSDVMGLCTEIRRGGLKDRDTFVIDTATTLSTMHLRAIVKADAADTNSKFNGKDPEQQHYKSLTTDMTEFYLEWCDLPRNIIFVTHDIDEQDELTKQWTTRIAHTPKLSEIVLTLMDAMLYMTADYPITASKPPTRTIRSMPTNRIRAKTRLGLPAIFPAEQMWDLIQLGSTSHQ